MTDAETVAVSKPSLPRRVFDNRVARLIALFFIVTLADALAQMASVEGARHATPESAVLIKIALTAGGGLFMLAVYALFVRWMEHRPVRELAVARAPGGLLAGLAIGLGLFAGVVAVLWALGIAHIEATPGSDLLSPVNMAVLSGIGEELIFRGVVYRILEEMFGSLAALIVSAAFFGAVHLANPGATLTSGAAVAVEAGLLLGVSYAAVRNLWLPMGLHAGWNFAESGIFGSVVSGAGFKGMLHTTLTGPEILTGGTFGPEASAVAVALCMTTALVIGAIMVRRGEWRGARVRVNDLDT